MKMDLVASAFFFSLLSLLLFRSSSFFLRFSYPVPYRFFLLFPLDLLAASLELSLFILPFITFFSGDKLFLCLPTNQHY